jgi:hypothetical protein
MRRVREHVAAHNWFAVLVDLIIVVLGVYLGIEFSNWNADRIARQSGAEYLARIERDIEDNEQDMRARSAYYEQVRAFGMQVLGDFDGTARLNDERFLIAAYQSTHTFPRALMRSTYDEVQAVGALETLGDAGTREMVASYYMASETAETNFSTVTGYREAMRRAIPYRVQQRIRETCAEIFRPSATGRSQLALPEACSLDLSPEQIARAAARVRATPGLELDLTRHLADVDQKLISFARLEDRARTVGERLAQAR